MRILHSSDWHLGRSLYGRKRYEEFEASLDWLIKVIEDETIDALLVAGDIFDTSTPGNRAQELYYRFLGQVSTSCCQHIVVIAGNHDSSSFLNAPREVLLALNVHVIGSITESLKDAVIVLYSGRQPRAIVCGIPYLRDRDIRTVEAGETIDDKNAKLAEGLKNHYRDVCGIARQKQGELEKTGHGSIPIVAMGHLFTAEGQASDGVRELYVGNLNHIAGDAFPRVIDYLALGHLHVPQIVGNKGHIRYCGSPIPMGFGESTQEKKIVIIEFDDRSPRKPGIREIPVPCFQQLIQIKGSLDKIIESLEKLKREKSRAWLEIEYSGKTIEANLQERLYETLGNSDMEILRIKNKPVTERVIGAIHEGESLDDIDPAGVFVRYLDAFDVSKEDRPELMACYNEIVNSIHEHDLKAG